MPVRVPRHLGSGLTPGRSKDSPILAKIVDALPAKVHIVIATDVTKLMRATKRRYALAAGGLQRRHRRLQPGHPAEAGLAGRPRSTPSQNSTPSTGAVRRRWPVTRRWAMSRR